MKIFGYQGNLSLGEIQTQIRFQEAGALKLVDCVASTDKSNQPINILKFEELAEIPNDIVLVKANDPKPTGTSEKVLTDVLVINNQFTTIDFYR
ncbi:hypothetical protein [Nitrosomonas ureae]|uniref:Uncharacterized protein n=1 Tax=Nitrosomonas ureae TaxID=44577 RepID=A0A1H2F5Z9_9PROT|nr:hypothetical protein [Nitrosomonas ureae]ALQ50433.1 hypothetical protein ATY38_03790 [Nitrosomonas ureae]SDU02747.1 hypothetical protein SAMN05216406_11813 [Nitrosomonas ureae]